MSEVTEYSRTDNDMGKTMLSASMRVTKVVLQRITVVKFGMKNRCCNSIPCFRIKVRVNATKFTHESTAGFG